uniref:Uncharacterized protein n=1 Tax=Anguilla anguilla TaxID=7936 RepID=A0A0E9S8G4_ANGAN
MISEKRTERMYSKR